MYFPLSTIKKFHVEIVFVAWLRDLSWEVKIVFLFFKKTPPESSLSFCHLICLFFDCKYHLHLPLFSLIVMAFPACTCELVHIQDSFEFLWVVSGLVCRSGSKDICTLQHGFLCFLLFLYLYFHSLACIITHLCFFIPSARSLRFGSRPWKVNIDQNWNPFLSLLVSENPRHLWLYFSRKCVFICYLFPLEYETRSW